MFPEEGTNKICLDVTIFRWNILNVTIFQQILIFSDPDTFPTFSPGKTRIEAFCSAFRADVDQRTGEASDKRFADWKKYNFFVYQRSYPLMSRIST